VVALRKFEADTRRGSSGVPPALGRHLAWAAARSLPMKTLFQSWIDAIPPAGEVKFTEPPPPGLGNWSDTNCTHRMEHPAYGICENVNQKEVEILKNQGWRLCITNHDFLQLVHLQAWYFQVRFFPRLKWLRLRTPPGRHFIIGDRPILWGFHGHTDVAPYNL
jgi:hypothetical protein